MNKIKNPAFVPLYEQFRREIKLAGKQPKTIDSYARSLKRLLNYFDCHPIELSEEDLKLYFADLLSSHSWSTIRVDRWGLRLFWERVLKKQWHWQGIVQPPRVKALPDNLTIEEVDQVIRAIDKFRYRACLFTIYSMGLRLSEGVNLRICDVDTANMRVHIRNAKGNKDCMVPLPKQTLFLLRRYWLTHRNPNRMFLAVHLGLKKKSHAAIQDCNIHKKATVHTLRLSYATHLVEAGVNLRLIQEFLGHANPNTTIIYAHLSKPSLDNSGEKIQKLMDRFRLRRSKQFFLDDDQ